MIIGFEEKGDWSKTTSFLKRAKLNKKLINYQKYGARGVSALYKATPKDTGKTAEGWYYDVSMTKDVIKLEWKNDYKPYGVPVAVLIQYGHGTKNGGYVQGIDYINPALAPIFDDIAKDLWTEVTKKWGKQ